MTQAQQQIEPRAAMGMFFAVHERRGDESTQTLTKVAKDRCARPPTRPSIAAR